MLPVSILSKLPNSLLLIILYSWEKTDTWRALHYFSGQALNLYKLLKSNALINLMDVFLNKRKNCVPLWPIPFRVVGMLLCCTLELSFCFFQQGFQPPMLIFVQSKERAKELFHELIYDGINVDVIHSDRTQAQVSCVKRVLFFLRALLYIPSCSVHIYNPGPQVTRLRSIWWHIIINYKAKEANQNVVLQVNSF